MNLYDLVNEELKRIQTELSYMREAWGRSTSNAGGNFYSNRHADLEALLMQYRTAVLDQFKGHDQAIQEKIAELALTGKSNG